jgi:hypothetical protein
MDWHGMPPMPPNRTCSRHVVVTTASMQREQPYASTTTTAIGVIVQTIDVVDMVVMAQ